MPASSIHPRIRIPTANERVRAASLNYSHGAVRADLRVCGPRLHDLVEAVVGHDSGDEQLAGADVVQRQRLDLGDVHAHFAVDAGALDANDHTEVR